ncbi:TROVE domain-containing protein [Terriglobus aquaticus]|uniref:TROVE domain-containing protein n=1 Tax=Terriglobus aquaticus TaxID=940139 RepID=A0ABW9KR12_9BACT|nr:TROVE domain-containing protein [Terriglobus aquaticus]
MYWSEGRVPLSAQVKKGLASAFTRFDEYALAKYDRAGSVRLRDVLFLCHAKPVDDAQAQLWKRLVAGELATPDTWEVALSSGGDKRAHWERLLAERKLGALALLRNLRNMQAANVPETAIVDGLNTMRTDRVLPFRYLAAARHAPRLEGALERAMFRSLAEAQPLTGHTVVLVDVSGSMVSPLSGRSEMLRTDEAYGLAMLLREVAGSVSLYTFSNGLQYVPARRGFALRDAMEVSQQHAGTHLGSALRSVRERCDRIVVITDEQSADPVPAPSGRGYMINVASAKHGVGYGEWNHIDGFSEAVLDYIRELEEEAEMPVLDSVE